MNLSTIQKRKDTINYKKVKRLLPSLKGYWLFIYDEDTQKQDTPFRDIVAEQCEGDYTPIEDYLNRLLNAQQKVIDEVYMVGGSMVIKVKGLSQD